MPAIVATLVRTLVQALVTTGILTVAEKYILPLIDKAIAETAKAFGATEDEAQDIVANEILQFAETAGILVLTLRTKMPTKIAERLGFTTKGWNKRKLLPKQAQKAASVPKVASISKGTTAAEASLIGETVAKTKGMSLVNVAALGVIISQVISVPTQVFFAAAQYIDFANWEGPYQGTFQKIIGFFGIEADRPNPKARTISNDVWDRIYATVEELNPETIAFPWTGEVRPYTRANLADAVDHFAANLAVDGKATSFKTVFGMLLPTISIRGKSGTGTPGSASPYYGTAKNVTASSGGSSAASVVSSLTTPKVQVFSGVLSQGYLGKGLEFQSRPDDLIENSQEMLNAAANNLAPWLASLTSRITYQVRVVSSITTKDGFTQKGSVVQVISGYSATGVPKYKTVVNKFAVLELYILNDKKARVKIETIVLGPVDSVKFQVSANTLTQIENAIQNVIATTDINDVKGVQTINPVTITTPPSSVVANTGNTSLLPVGTAVNAQGQPRAYKYYMNAENQPSKMLELDNPAAQGYREITQGEYNTVVAEIAKQREEAAMVYTGSITGGNTSTGSTATTQSATGTVSSQGTAPSSRPGANANTLSEWYNANGQSLPSVSERSQIYASYGLGQASYYTGTAEQNTKLLAKLKGL